MLPISTTYCVNNVPLLWWTSVRYLNQLLLLTCAGVIIVGLFLLRLPNVCELFATQSDTPVVKSIAYRCVVRSLLEYGWQL